MLIVALVLAVVSLAALVTAVLTSNEMIAWVCIGLSALGILLLIVDAIRDRHHRLPAPAVRAPDRVSDRTEVIAPVVIAPVEVTEEIEPVESQADVVAVESDADEQSAVADLAEYPDMDELEAIEDHPDEVVYDEPDYDTPSDDEPVYPVPAEEAAIHIVADTEVSSEETLTEDEHEDGFAESPESPESPNEPDIRDDSTTVIYAGQAYTDESFPTYTVTYADENGDDESVAVDERRESDSER